MSTETWLEANNRYLAASLEWLRLRLRRLAPEERVPASTALARLPTPAQEPADVAVAPSQSARRPWFGKRVPPAAPATSSAMAMLPPMTALPAGGSSSPIEDQVRNAAAARDAAARVDPLPALLLLAERFGLSPFERDTLLLCAAMEFDPSIASLCARAQGEPLRNHPTFALALSAFDDPSWEAIASHRPLRHAHLIETSPSAGVPLTANPLRADERVINFLKGLNVFDDRLATLVTAAAPGARAELAGSQRNAVETILRRLQSATLETDVPVVQLVGPDGGSRLAVAQEVCSALGRRLYRIGLDALPSPAGDLETFARLWQRESVLLPVALYIDGETQDGVPRAETAAALHRLLSRGLGLVFLGVREAPIRLEDASISAEIEKPTTAEQRETWRSLLAGGAAKPEADAIARALAGQFDLSLPEIREATSRAEQTSADGPALQKTLWGACRDLTRPRLDSLAQRLDAKATWDDLVLPPEHLSLMRQIAAQVRQRHKVYDEWGFSRTMNRGFGISALFTGESGTGKTMAAEVIANDLELDLYRIDLSAVVSKYIGETEKNLRRLFDAAEQGGAILFFDEADALFGKRSEVKDSHDRYANIEINYLLQRMEGFSGLAILATNMKSALDPAFMRRLRFVVHFPFPGVKERAIMWQKALPPQTPKEDLDYERVAKLNLSGGNIHSIALNAAFAAAQNGQSVTMPVLLSAARTELRKLEKSFSEAELR